MKRDSIHPHYYYTVQAKVLISTVEYMPPQVLSATCMPCTHAWYLITENGRMFVYTPHQLAE